MHKVIPTRFIMAECRSEGLNGFIIEMIEPFYVGKVFTYKAKDEVEYINQLAQSLWPIISIPGYQILIRFEGSLSKQKVLTITEGYAETHGQIVNMLKDMADFFMVEKIGYHQGYYDKFRIKSNMPKFKQ